MSTRRLLWQLYIPFLAILILSLIVVLWYASNSLDSFFMKKTQEALEIRAQIIRDQVYNYMGGQDYYPLDSLCKDLGHKTSTRITIILSDGTVIGDSESNPDKMENHAGRPELAAALSGRTGIAVRFSNTLQQNLMYVAIPLFEGNSIVGAIRTSVSVSAIDHELSGISLGIILSGIIVAIIAAVISLGISRKMSRPLVELSEGARRFADGDFDYKLPAPDTEEIRNLAEAMNKMAHQLDERFQTIVRQRNEQEAILASMTEGVIAVDNREIVLDINDAAGNLFGVDITQVEGKSIQEAIRNTDLHRMVAETLSSNEPVEQEIIISNQGDRFLRAVGTHLLDASQNKIGALIVFNDLTRLRHLENIRREFVANVSHELRTPITSIKGFVETLLDGPMKDDPDSEKFLRIIARQADRLNAIIEDILSLSRIEQEGEEERMEMEEGDVKAIIDAAVQSCEIKAREKHIQINRSCSPGTTAPINAPLLEHAVVNLIDNAIKYSEDGKDIIVACRRTDGEILISVTDKGIGISSQHIPRLFERFYRADKARSRKMGGTGLGLAIVKHIVLAHGGTIDVESEPGQGSTFTIRFPAGHQGK
ncbi:MAG: two-component system histidine kinase PnpS [Candidatus Zixiibacteriota bacterium]